MLSRCCSLIVMMLSAVLSLNAQQDDTLKHMPMSLPLPFEKLNIPDDFTPTSPQLAMPTTLPVPRNLRYDMQKDSDQYKQYGIERPKIQLNLNFRPPTSEWHPALFLLALVGAFFNNQIQTVPEEQRYLLMNRVYDDIRPAGRYEDMQLGVQKSVYHGMGFGGINYKPQIPKFTPYNTLIPSENKVIDPK